MIRSVVLENFKRFENVEFTLPGHLVVAGPNNAGKTTLLQAIASWAAALQRWKELNDFQRHGGAFTKAPLARQGFSAVPLSAFDLLWRDRRYHDHIAVTLRTDAWQLRMRFEADSTEQIYVRPDPVDPAIVRSIALNVVQVPAMTGLSIDEPVYTPARLDYLLGLGKPGDMLRNLLVEAHRDDGAWQRLQASIRRLFGYELLPPDASGRSIVALYRHVPGGPAFDIASAGSGFLQVLMLLTILNTRPGAVLLLDEPDAHLHVILQDAIYGELRSVAARSGSQLVVATHSEVIIDAADLRELCVLIDRPITIGADQQRRTAIESLRILSNEDILRAMQAPGVLYLEGYTDLEILRAFAGVLNHPARLLLSPALFWKPIVAEAPGAGPGVKARDHYNAMRLVKDLPALELVDGDSSPGVVTTPLTGTGFQRLRWQRYEIESYLVHPDALARFVEAVVGPSNAAQNIADLRTYLGRNLPPEVYEHPLNDHPYLMTTKARQLILPPALNAAGLPNLPYTRYHEIAALMRLEEIHPEVVEKLDGIVSAFGQV